MVLDCGGFILRPLRAGDEASIAENANDREVWRNLRDRFPHPYTLADAAGWIRHVAAQPEPPMQFGVILGGAAIGGIGLDRRADVHCKTAELGYWLGRRHWGKGIATAAVQCITAYAFATFDLERLEAGVFAWNPGSARVLEKAGYRLEARLERSVFKDGELIDTLLYVRLRDGAAPRTGAPPVKASV